MRKSRLTDISRACLYGATNCKRLRDRGAGLLCEITKSVWTMARLWLFCCAAECKRLHEKFTSGTFAFANKVLGFRFRRHYEQVFPPALFRAIRGLDSRD